MALGCDIIVGTLPSEDDTTPNTLATKVKNVVAGYTNGAGDVAQMTAVLYGTNQCGVIILHK